MNDPVVVKQSLKGNVEYIFLAFVMSLLSLMFIFVDFRWTKGVLEVLTQNIIGYYLLKIVFVLGFLLFGYAFLFLIKRAKDGRDILIVDDKGITDNSSALSFGFIPWMDIDNIYIDSFWGNQFIEIVLNNEEQYLKKLRGMKKLNVLANKRLKHQLICITLNSTGISPKELLPEIQEIFKQSKIN